jgi:hypothetical protein
MYIKYTGLPKKVYTLRISMYYVYTFFGAPCIYDFIVASSETQ